MESNYLTHEELAPKARASYGFKHLMARDTKPMRYVVVIGLERLTMQPTLLMSLTDRLRVRLGNADAHGVEHKYVSDSTVVTGRALRASTWPLFG